MRAFGWGISSSSYHVIVVIKTIFVGRTFPRLMSSEASERGAFIDNIKMKCLSVHSGSLPFVSFLFYSRGCKIYIKRE